MAHRLFLTVTDEMHEELKKLAQERGVPIAGMARKVLADWLQEQGRPVEWAIEWGGRREEGKGESE